MSLIIARAGRDRGREAELRAAAWLVRHQGMHLLARNWRHQRGEIDLILREGEVLVFVEVRLRAATARVSAQASLGRHKRRVLRRTCLAYLRRVRPRPERVRFDLVAWTDPGAGQPWQLTHHPGLGLLETAPPR